MRTNRVFSAVATGLIIILTLALACTKAPAQTTTTAPTPGGPGGGAIVNSDSVVTAKIQAIRPQTTGYPWEMDIVVQNSVDVGTLPNPVKTSVGKVVTAKTDEDMTKFKVGDVVTAKIKYVGDVPKPGITLYMYSITLQINPAPGH